MSIKRSAAHVLVLLAAVITGGFIMLEAVRADTGLGKITVLLLAAMIGIAGLALLSAFTTNGQMFMGLIYILIACTFLNQAFFAVHLGFFSLFIYRLLLIGAGALHIAGILTNRHHIDRWNRVNVKGVLMFFALWFTYGLLSLLWAKSVTYGIKYLALMGMGMFLIYLIVMFIQRFDQLMVFYGIWLVMTIFVMAIGFYNHFTHNHLPSSTLYNGPQYKQHYPTSVFFNQNDFATFLCISFFLYAAAVKNFKNGYVKAVSLLLAICALYLIILTGSRASLLGICAGAAVYVFILLPYLLKKFALYAAGAGAALFAVLFAGRITNAVLNLFSAPQAMPGQQPLPSNLARANLLKNAFHYVIDSWGFGVGAGNVSYYLKAEPVYDTGGVVEVHNWLVEIMANFGVLTMLGYLTVYLFLFWTLYKCHERKSENQSRLITEGLITAMAGFLVSSISPSSVSNLFFHWVFLSLVIAAVNILRRLQKEPAVTAYYEKQGDAR
ncbi:MULTISPECIES: teichuronic acid biosynthesis protein TuaE [Bacillus]|uniref:teichuronic acid biosynthesis protein TuaE n=1 Tax=Bacillus TaxID=1386 RepID=UPI00052AB169|nr:MULTISPECIES: O-antigen ligase family protein [Bacillus]AIU75587.1 Teichuronic acid biosynthesis protein TuaE [Bacillus subtilis]AXT14001.1 O-antigen ligase domain-containing protein [Bacillus velezensis]MDK4202593.1 O-antigen ligase family protein [Bacillus velezensis]MDM5204817.1 O-antigen ligase family protein [Bacillus velezensis]MEC3673294.1 O-antigen ligase family protein [Bacillus velezensis]